MPQRSATAETWAPCQVAIALHPSTQWCLTVYVVRGIACRSSTDAGPATADRRRNARRSITRRKPPAIPTGNHRAQRRGVHHKHQNHVHDEERREDPHRPEMPVPRRLKSAEQRSEPGELRRLVDRESREDRQHPEQNDERVRELLERTVLALRRMILRRRR